MPRKHRRVHHPRTNCRCPEGTIREVETCSKKGDSAKCKGRNKGCIAMVQPPGARKAMPRFVPLICDEEAGPVEQWKPVRKGGYRKNRKRKAVAPPQPAHQAHLFFREPQQAAMSYSARASNKPQRPTVEQMRQNAERQQPMFRFGHDDLPLFSKNKNRNRERVENRPSIPPWWRT